MDSPLVSIVTPTWRRHDLLLERCIPSVWAQSYPNVEHIVVSDGPDPELANKLFPPVRVGQRSRWFTSLSEHEEGRHWGHFARLLGIELASGELVGYCDDDDSLRPKHVELLVSALAEHPEAGWAYSWMDSHNNTGGVTTIGQGEPSIGNIGTPMIMHRRSVLEHGTWGPASDFEDWELVNKWIHVGIPYARVEETTVDVWPSIFFGH